MIKFYGYRNCGTCRKAEQSLRKADVAYTFIDITEHPPSARALRSIAELSTVEIKKLFNTSGVQYRELKIKERLPRLSDSELLNLLAGNGRLIKRPLVTDGERATVGFNEAVFTQTWG